MRLRSQEETDSFGEVLHASSQDLDLVTVASSIFFERSIPHWEVIGLGEFFCQIVHIFHGTNSLQQRGTLEAFHYLCFFHFILDYLVAKQVL